MAAPTEAWYFEHLSKRRFDRVTPEELRQLNQVFPGRYPFLLQSTAGDYELGRFDILFARPGRSIVLNSDSESPFLAALDAWWQQERIEEDPQLLPFRGGWFLYLGYELAGEIEPRLHTYDDPNLPTAFAVRCQAAVIIDHKDDIAYVVNEDDDSPFAEQVRADIASLDRPASTTEHAGFTVREDPPEQFTSAVTSAKKYIEAGDVYQANLSRQWSVSLPETMTSEGIYAALCEANPAPFAGIARWQGTAIISSSPERLLKIREGEISTRPIAGTRPRSADSVADNKLSVELFAHPKERAEHVMLIDLERNDLGRVCEAGSVEVNEMMVLESYAHVHHIVSNVRGRLRANVTPGDAIAAVFPGGTITGCPKVRCMEIISELELAPRGAYTGSFGYLNRDGSMDLNILIRTMVKRGNHLTFRAGAGIVADSDPDAELDEARAKAKGMLRALQHG